MLSQSPAARRSRRGFARPPPGPDARLGGLHSIAALAGIAEQEAGLASGLLNTSQQLGGAIAIASGVAASHTQALVRAGNAVPTALTGGFQEALWVLGAIALLALPAIFTLVRRVELSNAVTKTTLREAQPALSAAN